MTAILRLVIFLVGCCVCGAAQPATPSDPALAAFFGKLRAGGKQTVVAYGTSVTKDGAWVKLMEDWFAQKFPGQVTVINSGGRGQNSVWGIANVEPQVLVHKPDLVFIEFATNDAHERFKLTVAECRKNLDGIIAAIRSKNPDTAIVLQTMNVFWDAPNGFKAGDTSRPHLNDYNDNYRAAARELSLPLVDNYPVWLKIKQTDLARLQTLIPDGTHPNKNGSLEVNWPNVRAMLEAANR